MSHEKLFRFTIENLATGEETTIIGQGASIAAAKLDAAKTAKEPFQPSSSGSSPAAPACVLVRLNWWKAKGDDKPLVKRTLEEFEGDVRYGEKKPAAQQAEEVLEV